MEKMLLELKDIEKRYEGKLVLAVEQLKIYKNERIGIVGGNGQGKSTLLNIIAGEIKPDKGVVRKSVDFHYYRQIEKKQKQPYNNIDFELLSRLSVPDHSPEFYSGGESARFRLAQIFSQYRMGLLMDEPTTHLDSDGIKLLKNELKYYYGTVIVVSHNRAFLDTVVNQIWEVKSGQIKIYKGNYTQYKEQKEQEETEQTKVHNQYLKEKYRLEQASKEKQKQAQKLSKVSSKKKNRSIKPSRLSSSKQKDTVQKAAHKSAKAIEKRKEQLKSVERVVADKEIQFPQSEMVEIHNRFPIMGEQVTIKKGDKLLLNQVDFQFPLGKRFGIKGENGSGKSSLLNYILDNDEGITLSPKVIFAHYQQMDYKLTTDISALNHLAQDSEYPEPVLRSVLNNLGFNQTELLKSVLNLSGGEATRLTIAKLFTDSSNILVLDEPTNFIDIQTIVALESLMKNYQGTILFTSHDEYFMNNIAEQIWEIKNQKLVLIKE